MYFFFSYYLIQNPVQHLLTNKLKSCLKKALPFHNLESEKTLEFLKQEMKYGDFSVFVSIDDNNLKKH